MQHHLYSIVLSTIIFYAPATALTPEHIVASLTLEQKIGQLFMATAVVDDELALQCIHNKSYRIDTKYIEKLITDYHIGGIIYVGKSDPLKQISQTAHFQSLSTISLLVGQDLEPGRVGKSRLPDFFDFPNNKIIGSYNSEIAYYIGALIGEICTFLGVHINCAPVADVNNNPHNPVINDRSFGDNKENVAQHAIAFMKGLQSQNILACAKHFPGHGDTHVDSHCDLPVIPHNRERLNHIELYPFTQLITAGVDAMMIAHLEVPALEPTKNLPASLSKHIVTDLLCEELHFTGLIITDGLDMHGITKYSQPGERELQALLAGNDILLCSTNIPMAIDTIKQALISGTLTEQELDKHVIKILSVKEKIFKHHNRIPTLEKFKKFNHEKIKMLNDALHSAAHHKNDT